MSTYRHILVGIDLSEESQQLVQRVKQLAATCDGKISLVHIHEPISFAYGGDIPLDMTEIQAHLEEKAKALLASIGAELGVAKDDQHLLIGQPAHEMHRFADEHGVDLVIVGSHGRHGISLLFGSTASSLLHGADYDVLAVRLSQK